MNRLRTLTRPAWLLAAVATLGFTLACLLVLAPWQLGKNAAVHQRNETIADSTAPIPIEELRSPDAPPLATDEWRMVTMTGRYLPDREIVLRRRSAQGRSAVEIVSPFRLPDGTTIMVNRGYLLRGADDPTDAPAPPTGDATVVGRLRAPEDTRRFSLPRIDDDEVVAYALDPTRLGDAVGLRVPPMAVQLVADQPGCSASSLRPNRTPDRTCRTACSGSHSASSHPSDSSTPHSPTPGADRSRATGPPH